MLERLFLIIISLFFLNINSFCSNLSKPNISNVNDAKKSIQDYWNGISHIAGIFNQKNPNGSIWNGHLFLDRTKNIIFIECFSNGKIVQTIHNFEEGKPTNFLTIANHNDQTESKVDVRETPIGVLLKNPIDWSKFDFKKVELKNDKYQITLTLNDVTVVIFFMPVGSGIGVVSGWEIKSPNGKKTTINFDMEKLSINDPKFYQNHPFYKKDQKIQK